MFGTLCSVVIAVVGESAVGDAVIGDAVGDVVVGGSHINLSNIYDAIPRKMYANNLLQFF